MVQLDKLLGGRVAIKILAFLLKNSSAEFSQTAIRKGLKIAKLSASRWLEFMEENGIVKKSAAGRTLLYRLSRDNIIVKQLKVLFILSELEDKIGNLQTESQIYLFGSASRGEDTEQSDIDLLVIGTDRSLAAKLKALDSRIKVSLFTPVEWLRTSKEDRAFYERVEKDRIRLV